MLKRAALMYAHERVGKDAPEEPESYLERRGRVLVTFEDGVETEFCKFLKVKDFFIYLSLSLV